MAKHLQRPQRSVVNCNPQTRTALLSCGHWRSHTNPRAKVLGCSECEPEWVETRNTPAPQLGSPLIDKILRSTALAFHVGGASLLAPTRFSLIAKARHVATFLVRKHTGASYTQLAGLFGCKDHTSSVYACKTAAQLIEQDERVRAAVAAIEGEVANVAA